MPESREPKSPEEINDFTGILDANIGPDDRDQFREAENEHIEAQDE